MFSEVFLVRIGKFEEFEKDFGELMHRVCGLYCEMVTFVKLSKDFAFQVYLLEQLCNAYAYHEILSHIFLGFRR
jgi:hypothetical protein